jgi:NADPH:quinone reductase-like Zn-dependent oxidoreductase
VSDASIRAVVVDQPGDADTLRVRAVDAPRIGPGEVLVGIEAAGVNPVDTGNRADPT